MLQVVLKMYNAKSNVQSICILQRKKPNFKPCKATGKIILLYVLVDVFLDGIVGRKYTGLNGNRSSSSLIFH